MARRENKIETKEWQVRKIISIISIISLAFVSVFGFVYCLINRIEIPVIVYTIFTTMMSFLGFHYGKSTAIEAMKKGAETHDEYKGD